MQLGRADYRDVLQLQRKLFNQLVDKKKQHQPIDEEWIITVEHNPVITMGRHAKQSNLIASEAVLNQNNIECIAIERGGDITYHGPGQLVMYPIINLEEHKLGVKDYVNILEECVIRTIAEYGIVAGRVEGASGVWIDINTPGERKICALGVKCSRYITMHGLALNVNTDLRGFQLINPCGFIDKGVTSMQVELGHEVDIKEVETKLTSHFINLITCK